MKTAKAGRAFFWEWPLRFKMSSIPFQSGDFLAGGLKNRPTSATTLSPDSKLVRKLVLSSRYYMDPPAGRST